MGEWQDHDVAEFMQQFDTEEPEQTPAEAAPVDDDEGGYEEQLDRMMLDFREDSVDPEEDELDEATEEAPSARPVKESVSDKTWTESELTYLRSFARTGLHLSQIDLPGRSANAIHRKFRSLGLFQSKFRWSTAQTQSLLAQSSRGVPLCKIRVSGKDHDAIYSKARELGLHKPQKERDQAWTAEDATELRAAASEGLVARLIREQRLPDRSYRAIVSKARNLGLTLQKEIRSSDVHVRYTEEDRTLLRTLVKVHRLGPAQIKAKGHLTKHSLSSVRNQIERLGLANLRRSHARLAAQPWTPKERQLLRKLVVEDGHTPSHVVNLDAFARHTAAAVLWQIRHLALAPGTGPTTKKTPKRLTTIERERYFEFLRLHAANMDREQIAAHWDRSSSTVASDIRVLRLDVPRKFVPQKLANLKAVAKEFQIKRWATISRERKARLILLRDKLDRERATVPQRTCRACGERWYLTRDFFPRRHNKRRGEKHPFFTHRCVLCRRSTGKEDKLSATSRSDTGDLKEASVIPNEI